MAGGNQPWISQSNAAQPFDPSNGQTSRPFMGMLPGQSSHPVQMSSNQFVSPALGPTRTVPNSQQSLQPQQGGGGVGYPFLNGMGGSAPFSRAKSQQSIMQGLQGGGTPASLLLNIQMMEKQKFEMLFNAFCKKRGVKIDPRLLNIENRSLDVHALHVQVIQEGGFAKV